LPDAEYAAALDNLIRGQNQSRPPSKAPDVRNMTDEEYRAARAPADRG
jgi:hypothetical protein